MEINSKKILITGATGMLGCDLCELLEQSRYDLIKTNSKILDITNKKAVFDFVADKNPDIIIHCAAYTNVDKAEDDFENARKVNSKGSENLAQICKEKEILLIYVSTDYVFDGEKQTPYLTTDLPNPINNYGLTKFEGEKAIQKHCKKFYIARTSWLYGLSGKNFVETMISLKDNEILKVVDDQTGCPTSTKQLSRGILKLVENYNENIEKSMQKYPFGIYHLCSSGSTTWYGFAREIFEQMNLKTNLMPCLTKDFPRKAKRPQFSVMENNAMLEDWREGLREYLKERINK